MRDLPEPPADALGRLRFWAEYETVLDSAIADAVEDARAAGSTWMDIGAALGLSAEGARIRQHRRNLRLLSSQPAGA